MTRITDYAPYIKGELYMAPPEGYAEPYRATSSDLAKWAKLLEEDSISKELFAHTEDSKEFFRVCTDIAHFVKPAEREEMFYSLKNGFTSPVVPAKLIYLVKKAYALHNIPNLIVRLLPEDYLNTVFTRSYISGGFTLMDVICNFCNKEYRPISSISLKVDYSDFSEIYINETNMIACVPKDISELLKPEDIQYITVGTLGLKLSNNTYLANLAGYRGACNSIYDLRRLV